MRAIVCSMALGVVRGLSVGQSDTQTIGELENRTIGQSDNLFSIWLLFLVSCVWGIFLVPVGWQVREIKVRCSLYYRNRAYLS